MAWMPSEDSGSYLPSVSLAAALSKDSNISTASGSKCHLALKSVRCSTHFSKDISRLHTICDIFDSKRLPSVGTKTSKVSF